MSACPVIEPTHNVRAGRVKILLVDDTPENLISLEAALEALDEELVLANSGKEALRYLLDDDFAAILLDVKMPEMDGFAATRAIRERERGKSRMTPIVALTAHAMKGDDDRCREADMDGYVAKPIRPADLFGAIDSVWAARKVDSLLLRP